MAVCCGLAAAQMQICDNKKAPGKPWNSLQTSNRYDAATNTTKMDLTWRSPVKSSTDGCVTMYRLETYDNGQKVKTEMVKTSPAQEKVSYTTAASPGKTITLKVVAIGNTGESQPETVGTIKAAAAPATAVPL